MVLTLDKRQVELVSWVSEMFEKLYSLHEGLRQLTFILPLPFHSLTEDLATEQICASFKPNNIQYLHVQK